MQQIIAYIIQQAAALGMSALQYITNIYPDLVRRYGHHLVIIVIEYFKKNS